jgi:hypothetical protein
MMNGGSSDFSVIGDNDIINNNDDDNEELYICRRCGEVQWIEDFPHLCDSCETSLGKDDVEKVENISQYDEGTRDSILLRLQEKREELN